MVWGHHGTQWLSIADAVTSTGDGRERATVAHIFMHIDGKTQNLSANVMIFRFQEKYKTFWFPTMWIFQIGGFAF